MRKFTKEITALLAAAAVGSAAAVVNAEPLIKDSETNTSSFEIDMNGIREEGVVAVTDDMIVETTLPEGETDAYSGYCYEEGTRLVTTEDFAVCHTVGEVAVPDNYIEAQATTVTGMIGTEWPSTPPTTTTVTSYTGMIGTEWPTSPYEDKQVGTLAPETTPYDTETFYETGTVGTEENVPVTGDAALIITGDINCDGVADITDLTKLSVYLMLRSGFDELQLRLADVDANGIVDIADLARFKQYISHDSNVNVLGSKN